MSKIIRKVVLGSDGGGMACGPCGGQWVAEMIIDHDGKEVYISGSDIGEDALYFVSDHSIYNLLVDMDTASRDESEEEWEIGPCTGYEVEEDMAESEYYNCFKYLRKVIRSDYDDPTEYPNEYGKDIDQMENLKSFAEMNGLNDVWDDEDFELEFESKEEMYLARMQLEAEIGSDSVYKDMDGSIQGQIARELYTIMKMTEDQREYESWKEKYLSSEYEKVKELEWITVGYLFAGIGSYETTMPKEQLDCFKEWIRENGSAFMGNIREATEEEVKNALALHTND